MKKLTREFSEELYASKDGRPAPPEVLTNLAEVHKVLLYLKDTLGWRISILSGYRSPHRNRVVGGARKSQHLKGRAADITVKGLSPKKVHEQILRLMVRGPLPKGGIGRYKTFTHIDIRGNIANWRGKRVKADG